MYLAQGAGQRRFALNPARGRPAESHQADRVSLGTGRSPETRKHQMITAISGLAAPPVRYSRLSGTGGRADNGESRPGGQAEGLGLYRAGRLQARWMWPGLDLA